MIRTGKGGKFSTFQVVIQPWLTPGLKWFEDSPSGTAIGNRSSSGPRRFEPD